jgi:hypothetical protein
MPPAGWYPDPEGQPGLRYWDGATWTEHRHQPTPEQAGASPPPQNSRGTWVTLAVVAQVGVCLVTFVLGGTWAPPSLALYAFWFVALAQATLGLFWLARRGRGPVVVAVPVVSLALTIGLWAIANSVGVVCSDRALAAFEELSPPPGTSVETYVGDGCMARTTGRVQQAEVFDHYRNEFKKRGWDIQSDEREQVQGVRDGVVVTLEPGEFASQVIFTVEESSDGNGSG